MKLRTRLLVGVATVLAVTVVVGVSVVSSQRAQLLDQLDRRLSNVVPLDRPPVSGDQPDVAVRPVARPISDVYLAELGPDGTTPIVEGQLLRDAPDLSSLDAVPPTGRLVTTVDGVDGIDRFRVLAEPIPGTDTLTVIALPTGDVDETVQRLALTFGVGVGIIALVLGLLAWWIIRLGLRPIAAVAETARSVAAGERDRRAPVADPRTEAGELAGAFNLMLDERDAAERRLRRFAADASHELRTPLTSIRGYLDLYASGAFRDPAQLDDVMVRMRSESARMHALVTDLLQLARHDESPEIARTSTDVGAAVRGIAEDARAGHPDRIIRVDAPKRLVANVDPARFTQLVALLVDNALTHAPDATVEVAVQAPANGGVELTVADDGPGLSSDQAAEVFRRFYRGDASRSRSTGGSGLGLSIAEAIVTSHGGTIDLETAPGRGCTFRVRLP